MADSREKPNVLSETQPAGPDLKRVVVFGPESTGKTTLCRMLAEHFGTVWVPEFVRGYLDQKAAPGEAADIPLIALGQMLAIVWVILLLASAATYWKWLKFSLFYIPIAVVLALLIYPLGMPGTFPSSNAVPATYGVYPFGYLYILITLIIVILGWWRSRKTSTPQPTKP